MSKSIKCKSKIMYKMVSPAKWQKLRMTFLHLYDLYFPWLSNTGIFYSLIDHIHLQSILQCMTYANQSKYHLPPDTLWQMHKNEKRSLQYFPFLEMTDIFPTCIIYNILQYMQQLIFVFSTDVASEKTTCFLNIYSIDRRLTNIYRKYRK